jgi:hypothetical protein
MGLATFWAILSQTHLVTLIRGKTYFLGYNFADACLAEPGFHGDLIERILANL